MLLHNIWKAVKVKTQSEKMAPWSTRAGDFEVTEEDELLRQRHYWVLVCTGTLKIQAGQKSSESDRTLPEKHEAPDQE